MSSDREAESDSSPLVTAVRTRKLAAAAVMVLAATLLSLPAAAQDDFAFDGGATVLLAGTPVNVTVSGPRDRLEALTLRLVQDGEMREYASSLADDLAVFEVTALS